MSTQSSFLTEKMRQQAIGVAGPSATLEVEKGAIIKFAQAIGDENPVFNDEAEARRGPYGTLIAPPTFLRLASAVRPELPFEVPFDRRLDGGSDWEYFYPVRPGDRINTVSRIADLAERNGRLGVMLITTILTTYTNQFDEVVATQTVTSIRY